MAHTFEKGRLAKKITLADLSLIGVAHVLFGASILWVQESTQKRMNVTLVQVSGLCHLCKH